MNKVPNITEVIKYLIKLHPLEHLTMNPNTTGRIGRTIHRENLGRETKNYNSVLRKT